MSAKYSFQIQSKSERRMPSHKIVLGQRWDETESEVLLKMLGYALFYRERIQIEPRLDEYGISLIPHLAQLDYQMRPAFWAECGELEIKKVDRLAVKVHQAEIWILRRSAEEAEALAKLMKKHKLRRDRYNIIGFDSEMFEEMRGEIKARNDVWWEKGVFDPPNLQFEFNGLWFDAPFVHLRH